jgi:hypothetical protein
MGKKGNDSGENFEGMLLAITNAGIFGKTPKNEWAK